MKRIFIFAIAATALLASSCGGRQPKPAQVKAPRTFSPALAPVELSEAGQIDFLRFHYWDRFPFEDTTILAELDTLDMIEAYARWVQILFNRPTDGSPVDSLMRRAAASRSMTDYFSHLAAEVLHDPNSPLRNDELYIPVLRAQLAAPWYDEYERIAPEYDLTLAMQNRVGHTANDFRYTLATGRTGSLHAIGTQFTLLFISNPGCPMCGDLREQISSSPMLNQLLELDRLTILALYPDEDLAEWRAYQSEIPPSWINAYDDGCILRGEGLYNLAAIPSLYLLDHTKRVLVKDSTSVAEIEDAIDRNS